jgi:hypothetical protein
MSPLDVDVELLTTIRQNTQEKNKHLLDPFRLRTLPEMVND